MIPKQYWCIISPFQCFRKLSWNSTALILLLSYICFDFLPISSIILNGLGWFLCNIGSIVILLLFKCKLRTIKEPKRSSKKPRKFGIRNIWSTKFVIFSIIAVTLVTLSIILEANEVPLFTLHIHILFNITIVHICLPKYYISQNENLKLFFNTYHHQPPPVLPWQLPTNFDSNSVKFLYVKSNKEGVVGETWRDPCLE